MKYGTAKMDEGMWIWEGRRCTADSELTEETSAPIQSAAKANMK
jgi:hypothetical protein